MQPITRQQPECRPNFGGYHQAALLAEYDRGIHSSIVPRPRWYATSDRARDFISMACLRGDEPARLAIHASDGSWMVGAGVSLCP